MDPPVEEAKDAGLSLEEDRAKFEEDMLDLKIAIKETEKLISKSKT